MKKIAKILLTVFLFVAIILFWNSSKDFRMELRIKYSSKNNENFSFGSFFDKNWTVAYIEYDSYTLKSDLKEKYNTDYNFKELFSDIHYRIVILQDSIVLNEYIFSFDNITIDSNGLPITPDSIFITSKHVDGRTIFRIK